MQENEDVLELLKRIKYRQHQKRMIVNILDGYPSLQNELESIIEMGAKRIEIEQNHALTKPRMEKRGETAVLYLND